MNISVVDSNTRGYYFLEDPEKDCFYFEHKSANFLFVSTGTTR